MAIEQIVSTRRTPHNDKVSQTQRAALSFIGDHDRITVWRWETGKPKPSVQTIRLMRALP
jgi:hypothetical protein